VCNLIDDNCDGEVDEGIKVELLPDVDGDGYGDDTAATTPGCVGTAGFTALAGDCDDSVSNRHIGASEVCNGTDDDCDGLVDDINDGVVICASGTSKDCTTAGGIAGQESCSNDCLGYDKCVGPEACNGLDDDGDSVADENFACVLGVVSVCQTSCGTSGVRQCVAGCVAGPCSASEICNFCDDDGTLGIAGESALATSLDGPRVLEADWAVVPTIDASYAGIATLMAEGNGNGYDTFVRLLDGEADTQAGAYWVDLQRYQGWGTTMIVAEMELSAVSGSMPMGGWSIVVATGGTGDLGPASDRGVPSTRTGARLDWIWGMPYQDVVDLDDRVAFGRLASPTQWRGQTFAGIEVVTGVPTRGTKFDGQTEKFSQSLVLIYQPENPYTLAREETVNIAFPTPGAASCVTSSTCSIGETCVHLPGANTGACLPTVTYRANSGTTQVDPANDIPVGSVLSIGITAGSYAYEFTPMGAPFPFTANARVVADLKLKSFNEPPGGSGLPPVTIPYSSITRDRVCPGGY
jgi:hypothetical protein